MKHSKKGKWLVTMESTEATAESLLETSLYLEAGDAHLRAIFDSVYIPSKLKEIENE